MTRPRYVFLFVILLGAGLTAGAGLGGWRPHLHHAATVSPKQAAEAWALTHLPARFRSRVTGLARDNTYAVCYPTVSWPAFDLRHTSWTCSVGNTNVAPPVVRIIP